MVRKDLIAMMLGGRLIQKVVSITLVNNVTLNEHVDVPAGKQWLLLAVKAVNGDDVDRAIDITIYKEVAATNLLRRLIYAGTVTPNAHLQWPSYSTNVGITSMSALVLLKGGNRIRATFVAGGASTGATDADGLVLEYIEYDM